jgi:hypothetical protein
LGMPFAFATDKAYLMAATKIAAGSITQDMQVTKWGMSVIEPGELRLTLYPSNLVSAAYADLGALICKRVEFKEYPDMAVCSGTRPVGSGNITNPDYS